MKDWYTFKIWFFFWKCKSFKKQFEIYFPCIFNLWLLPYSPSGDAYALDDADANLGHEHKEELHEVERAVTPMKKQKLYLVYVHTKCITTIRLNLSYLV